MSTIIEFQGVTTKFGDVTALEDVDLAIEPGEITGIIGYSGAGKSTLVRLVNALEPVTSGRVLVDGVDLTALGERELRRVRAGIGMVFQQFNLAVDKAAPTFHGFNGRTQLGIGAGEVRAARWPASVAGHRSTATTPPPAANTMPPAANTRVLAAAGRVFSVPGGVLAGNGGVFATPVRRPGNP